MSKKKITSNQISFAIGFRKGKEKTIEKARKYLNENVHIKELGISFNDKAFVEYMQNNTHER